jgi:hypothetical protein
MFIYYINVFLYAWSILINFSSFYLNSMHSFYNYGKSINLCFISLFYMVNCNIFIFVTTPLLEECEDDTHTLEMGTWESSGTPETSEFDYRG